MSSYLCAVDVGTTGVKAGIFDVNGRLIKESYHEYSPTHVAPNLAEQDPEELWAAQCKVLKEIIGRGFSGTIEAVCMTNQRVTFLPVDKTGKPLTPYIVWSDRRGIEQCEYIREYIGEKHYYRTTGLLLDPTPAISKILWLKENHSDIYHKTYRFWQIPNMHLYRMGVSDPPCDPSNGAWFGFLDINSLEWNEDLLRELDVSKGMLPSIAPTGTIVGKVSKTASFETGLLEGTPIVLGGGDQQVGSIGSGVIESGVVSVSLGTAAGVMAYNNEPVLDEKMSYYCQPHAVPGAWEMEGFTLTAGGAFRWYRDNVGIPEKDKANSMGIDPYDLICKKASEASLGSQGLYFIPTMSGAVLDPFARGAWVGLTLAHDRNSMARSILEGISYELKDILDSFEKGGFKLKEVRITGGGAKSDFWGAIQADIYGVPVVRPIVSDAPLLGCTFLAGVGAGVYTSLSDFVNSFLKIDTTFYPDNQRNQNYISHFKIYQKIFKALSTQGIFREIAI